jgi:hypothetical protein
MKRFEPISAASDLENKLKKIITIGTTYQSIILYIFIKTEILQK